MQQYQLQMSLLDAILALPDEIVRHIASYLDIDGRRLLGVYGKVTPVNLCIPKLQFDNVPGMNPFYDYYDSTVSVHLGKINLIKYFRKNSYSMVHVHYGRYSTFMVCVNHF